MIKEFIKEYHQLKWQYENKIDDAFWFLRELDNLVDRYETELNIQSLKELKNENIKSDKDTGRIPD